MLTVVYFLRNVTPYPSYSKDRMFIMGLFDKQRHYVMLLCKSEFTNKRLILMFYKYFGSTLYYFTKDSYVK